jgi:hypothetical protein
MRDDRRWYENAATAEQRRKVQGLHNTGSELERKYWVALVLYAVLGALAWFTMGAGEVLVMGRPVELRLVPLVILGGLALRTVVALQADKIRHGGEKGSSSGPESL